MTAAIIDGKAIAADLRAKVATEVARLKRDHGVTPGLAVVLVGTDPASEVYVRSKSKAVIEAGMAPYDHKLPATASEAEVLALVAKLNADPAVSGILVQLPLPPQIDAQKVIAAIDPEKDVDGFHPLNAGRLASGLPGAMVPLPNPNTIYWGGYGGSLAIIDMDARTTFAYAMNRMVPTTTGDSRGLTLAAAMWGALAS